MRQSITTGLGLLAVGVASARAAAGIAGHGLPSTAAPTARAAVAAGMAAGSCTGLGVVALLTGWAHRSR